jgi:hypothetical protein
MQYALPTDFSAKYSALAVFDPITGTMMAVTMAGAGASAAGTLAGGASAAAMGRASAGEATFEAAQSTTNAASDIAAAQRRMIAQQQSGNLLVGAATARAGASGTDPGLGSTAENVGEIAQKSKIAAALDLWNGQNAAAGELDKAQAQQYQSTLDLIGGQAAQKAATYSGRSRAELPPPIKFILRIRPAAGRFRPQTSGPAARVTRCTVPERAHGRTACPAR